MIPKILHFIWVGDLEKRPNRCIQSWVDLNPGWTIRIWGNSELNGRDWINSRHIREMETREWNGVADMMRWEILFDEGGVLVDADSYCLRALPDWLLECEAFCCWENERARPGLIAAGYFGTVPRNPFLALLVEGIRTKETVIDRMAWETVGPRHLTETWQKSGYDNLTILPSHFFIPRHFTGVEYTGAGPVFAQQEWGSTLHRYEALTDGAFLGGQNFLYEPDWRGVDWVEVVLSYLEAFSPGDPVALVLVLDPATPGQVPLAQAEAAVIDIVARTGRERFPDIVMADDPLELPQLLRKHPSSSWIPEGRGNTRGLRGTFGARLADARIRMAMPLQDPV